MQKKFTSHIVAGAIIGGVMIGLLVLYYYTNLIFESNYISFIPPLVTILMVTLFVIKYGNDNGGNVTFGNLFGYGFRITIIFALTMTAFFFIILNFFPEYKQGYMQVMIKRMNMQSDLTPDQRQATLDVTNTYFRSIIIGYNLFINLIAGTAGSLLGAWVSPKKPQSPTTDKV